MARCRSFAALVFVALFALTPAAKCAAEDAPTYAPAIDAHAAGRWSMQFEIRDNFQLGSFAGSGISVTKNTSPTGAWRLGVSYGGTVSRSAIEESLAIDDSLVFAPGGERDQDSNTAININLGILHRSHPDHRVGLIFLLGPSLTLRHQSNMRNDFPSNPTATLTSDFRSSSQFYGLNAELGTEVFVARAISLHAHYGGRLGYSHATQTSTRKIVDTSSGTPVVSIDRQESSGHSWSLKDQGVTFGLSVYL